MSNNDVFIVSQAIGFGIFLWLGLYVLSRASHRTPIVVVSLLALFSQATFFLSDHIITITTNEAMHDWATRLTWWDNVMPMAFWFHLSSLIARGRFYRSRSRSSIFTPLVVLSYVVAIAISLLGAFTSFILNNDNVAHHPDGTFYTGAGAAFVVYIVYLLLAGSGAIFNLVSTFLGKLKSALLSDKIFIIQLGLLAGGGILFLAGGLWLACRLYWYLPIPELPGDVSVIAGLATLGYGIANYNLLLEDQNIQRDFFYSFTGIAVVNTIYVTILYLFKLDSSYVLLIVGLVTVSHSSINYGQKLLDKIFFNKAEQEARAEARAYAQSLASTPTGNFTLQTEELTSEAEPVEAITTADVQTTVEPEQVIAVSNSTDNSTQGLLSSSQKEFNDLIRKAITGLKNPTQLAKSPLLSLKVVGQGLAQSGQEDNRLNRVGVLREILIEQIEGLKPGDSESSNQTGDAWRFYNVLHYPYVRAISRKAALGEARRLADERRRSGQREAGQLEQVLNWLADVDEDTFYKWQRRASDTIAEVLWEQEFKSNLVLEEALHLI